VARFNEAARERRARGDARNLLQSPPLSSSWMTNSEIVIQARVAPRCSALLGRRQSAAKPEQTTRARARRRVPPQRRPVKRVWHIPAAQQASVADSRAPTAFRLQS
jgi:hypothetical protein